MNMIDPPLNQHKLFKGSRTLSTADDSPPDENKTQLLPTRTTIPWTTPHYDKSPPGPLQSHAWVNQRGLRSGNKILPRSAQILIVIGKAFAMDVNARSSNHEPNHEADRDPKRLSEGDSFLCEHSP